MKRLLLPLATLSITIGGYVHFRLWYGPYHHAPIREMFLLNVSISAFVAVAVLIPGRLGPLAGVVLSAGSLAAIAASRTTGLPTPHGRWAEMGLAPAGQTLFGVRDTLLVIVVETIAVVACLTLAVIATRAGSRATRADRAELPVAG